MRWLMMAAAGNLLDSQQARCDISELLYDCRFKYDKPSKESDLAAKQPPINTGTAKCQWNMSNLSEYVNV